MLVYQRVIQTKKNVQNICRAKRCRLVSEAIAKTLDAMRCLSSHQVTHKTSSLFSTINNINHTILSVYLFNIYIYVYIFIYIYMCIHNMCSHSHHQFPAVVKKFQPTRWSSQGLLCLQPVFGDFPDTSGCSEKVTNGYNMV